MATLRYLVVIFLSVLHTKQNNTWKEETKLRKDSDRQEYIDLDSLPYIQIDYNFIGRLEEKKKTKQRIRRTEGKI